MKYQGDYKGKWKANLMVKGSLGWGLYKVVSFNSLSRARLWAMREAKKLIAGSGKHFLSLDDILVKIDERQIVGYEISSKEILKNSERVL
jgi:hypothetical protein